MKRRKRKHDDRRPRLGVEALEDRRMLTAASFAEVSAQLGIAGLQGGSGEFHGGGLVFTDLTADGYADLYLIGRSSIGNRLYVNVDDGQGGRTFQRVANDGGTGYSLGNSVGAVAADYDNDGDLDIYLNNYRGANILYRNMWFEDHPSGVGDPTALRFTNATASTDPTPTDPVGDLQEGVGIGLFDNPDAQFGLDVLDNTMSSAWADVNRDGWVDLYVGSWDGTNGDPASAEDGQLGERDTLYLNNGDGTFTDVTMGPAGATVAAPLIDDGSFESATPTTQVSGSDWTLTGPAQFQEAPWAASDQAIGVWFKGFEGSSGNPLDATLTQTVTAPEAGDYTLRFDARVEANFPSVVGGFQVTISSDGTGGSDTIDLLAAALDTQFNTYTVSLTGVSAGDDLTIAAAMIDATGGVGPALSGMVDAFFLDAPGAASGWEQVGGWAYSDGSFNDPSLPAEFSGQNGLQFADFNNDGWQDLIVATMGGGGVGPNRDMLYINRGVDGTGEWLGYELVSYEIGFGGTESSDMGVTVADVDNDGDLDYFSTLLPDQHPIWINNLVETGELSFTRTEITNTFAWGANFHDFDNNGRVDLLVGTEVDRPSFLHLQELDGTFSEQAGAAGLTSTYSTRGVAAADLDRDGYSDAALWSINAASPGLQLYQNNSAALNNHSFLTLELVGDPTLAGQFRSTRDAIGARAHVTADFDGDGQIEADETRIEEVLSGHANGGTTSSLALEFGLGQAERADVTIAWGSGRTTTLRGVLANQFVAIKEQAADVDVLLGDYNGDRVVDLADYTKRREQTGQSVTPFTGADGNGDGTVDAGDHAVWAANVGLTAPPIAASSLQQGGVPEEAAAANAGAAESPGAALTPLPVAASRGAEAAPDAGLDEPVAAAFDRALLLLLGTPSDLAAGSLEEIPGLGEEGNATDDEIATTLDQVFGGSPLIEGLA